MYFRVKNILKSNHKYIILTITAASKLGFFLLFNFLLKQLFSIIITFLFLKNYF